MTIRSKKILAIITVIFVTSLSTSAHADMFGGDDLILTQILAETIEELSSLQSILGTGSDTLQYIQGINDGLRDALSLMKTQNTTLTPGVFSQIQNVDQALAAVQGLYGKVPNTSEGPMQQTTDQSVAEAIQMHNDAFKYADGVDQEGERIKDYARVVSPQGAERLTAESLGVLITVMNQVLRTNAAMLKLQSEQLAMNNRHQKLESEHFNLQYEGLSQAFGDLRPEYDLPSFSQ